MKTTKYEKIASEMLRFLSDGQLLELWEDTSAREGSASLYMARGWLMDEIKRRWPDAFDAWLDGEAEDSTLREYISTRAAL